MNSNRSRFVSRIWLTSGLILVLGLMGCGGGSQTAPTKTSLQKLAMYYGTYITAHKGAAPANEAQLQAFIKEKAADDDLEKLFRSERDGQAYVVFYLGATKVASDRVIAHEKDGLAGKRFVAFSTTAVRELDEAEFKQALEKR